MYFDQSRQRIFVYRILKPNRFDDDSNSLSAQNHENDSWPRAFPSNFGKKKNPQQSAGRKTYTICDIMRDVKPGHEPKPCEYDAALGRSRKSLDIFHDDI